MKRLLVLVLFLFFIACSSPDSRLHKVQLTNANEIVLIRTEPEMFDCSEVFVTIDTVTKYLYLTKITQNGSLSYKLFINHKCN